MGNVNLPTPVALAGAGICVLGGYLLGVVSGPEPAGASVATVADYDADSGRLCLRGETVADHDGAHDDRLCGEWRRASGDDVPAAGDRFRFVTMTAGDSRGTVPHGQEPVILIYGDVVP